MPPAGESYELKGMKEVQRETVTHICGRTPCHRIPDEKLPSHVNSILYDCKQLTENRSDVKVTPVAAHAAFASEAVLAALKFCSAAPATSCALPVSTRAASSPSACKIA